MTAPNVNRRTTCRKGGARTRRPVRYVGMCAMLTEVRRTPTDDLTPEEADCFAWVASGNADVQQQALRDFDQAPANFLGGTHGYPHRRKKYRREGFRSRQVRVAKLNKKWAQVQVPGCGWVKFHNTRRGLPNAKTFRVTYQAGRWYVSFATVPEPVGAPGNSTTVGVDRGVAITAALSDGRVLNCPQPSARERARLLKHQRRAARAPKGSPKRRDEYTRSARGTVEEPGRRVTQKAGLNREILAQGWGLLRTRTGHKAPGRVEDVLAAYTSLRCSDCRWIDKNPRKGQAEFVCSHCGFTCNAGTNASLNVAAGEGGIPAPAPRGRAGGTTRRRSASVCEPRRLLLFE